MSCKDLCQVPQLSSAQNSRLRPQVAPTAGILGSCCAVARPPELSCFFTFVSYLSRIELLETTIVWLNLVIIPQFLLALQDLHWSLGFESWKGTQRPSLANFPSSDRLSLKLLSEVMVWSRLAQHLGLDLMPAQQTTPLERVFLTYSGVVASAQFHLLWWWLLEARRMNIVGSFSWGCSAWSSALHKISLH